MPPENLPTEENMSTSYQGDWWILEKLHQYNEAKGLDFNKKIQNTPIIKGWKLSLSSSFILLLVLIGLGYTYTYRNNISSILPNTSHYAVATINKVEIVPNFFKTLSSSITNKYDLTAAMIYLKKIGSRDSGNTIIIDEGKEEIVLEKPLRIKIAKIGVNSSISNPTSTNLDILNKALDSGAVRYPSSGLLGENKTVFVFGHSTSLETDNIHYKTFNGLETLKKGDEIIVESLNNQYIYKVKSVKETNTTDGAIRIDSKTQKLTISTCDTLGAKEDRFVVEADFVKMIPLESSTNNSNNTSITPSAGTTENRTYRNDPVISPILDNLYGFVDLEATIDAVGILDSNNNFIATSTFNQKDIGAVKFTVKNIGDKKSDGWTFNAVLPTSPAHIFHSEGQKPLAPKEKIEFTMGFDKLRVGEQMPIIINVDPSGGMKESNKNNNIVKSFIDIAEVK